jgi:hypothetical protein
MKLEKQKMELLSIKLYAFQVRILRPLVLTLPQGKLNAAKRILRITMKNTEPWVYVPPLLVRAHADGSAAMK